MRNRFTPLLATLALSAVASAQAPLFTFFGTASDDRFGTAVSCAGDVDADGFADVIVGAPLDDTNGADAGAVRVLSGSDGSVLYTFLGDAAGDLLGSAVSGAGDVDGDGHADVIAGAPGDDNTGSEAGSARVYSGADGSVLYTFDGDGPGDALGHAVAGGGDINQDGYTDLIAGAPGDDNTGSESGSARVYSGVDGSVLYTFDGGDSGDQLGWSVASGGDANGDGYAEVIAGAPFDDDQGTDAGRAFVFSGSDGAVLWTFDGAAAGDQLGWSVSGAGDADGDGSADIACGAPLADANGPDAGSVRVHSGASGAVLWTFDGDAAGDNLGWSVTAAGDQNGDSKADVAAGAPLFDGGAVDSGGVRVWSGADGKRLRTIDGTHGDDRLGAAVACSGDIDGDGYADLIVGVPHDDREAPDAGAALVFARQPWDRLEPALTQNPAASNARFGRSLGAVGDVNRDGITDYAIGAFLDAGTLGTTRVYSGADHSLLHTFTGHAFDIYFGLAVSSAGDINQDGYGDVFVGAQHDDTITQDSGLANVYSGLDGTILRTYLGPSFRSHLGTALGCLGDVNGDGVDDLWAGMGLHNSEVGAIRVISGGTGALLYEIPGRRTREWFGWSGETVGDLNGDGILDFVIGAPAASGIPPAVRGRAQVFSGANGASIYQLEGIANNDRFGWACGSAGDVNRDGTPDVIVGAPYYNAGALVEAGRVRVYSGATAAILHEIDGEAAGDHFGHAVGGGSDVDGDGFGDFLVGAAHTDPGGILDVGSAYVYSGRDGTLLQRLDGEETLDGFGWHVAGLGDLTGDGYGEVLVSVPYDDDPVFDSGTVRVFEGGVKSDPGTFLTYGAACRGSNGDLPGIGARVRPVVGRPFPTTLSTAAPLAPIALWIAASRISLPLEIIGAPGCTMLALPLLSLAHVTDATGRAAITLPLPGGAPVGGALQMQWIIVDLPASTLGVVLSNGGTAKLGRQ